MPDRRTPPPWRQLRPGAAYLTALLLLAATVFSIDVIQRRVVEGPTLRVTAAEARGLVPGGDVWVAGVRAGRVVEIRFRDPEGPPEQRVEIEAVLWRQAAGFLREDATARVTPSALLAPVVLSIDPGTAPGSFRRRSALQAQPAFTPDRLAAQLAAARAAADTLAAERRRLRARLEEGRGTMASLRRDPGLVPRLASQLRRAAELSRSRGGSVRPLLADTELRAAAGRIRSRLEGTAEDAAVRAATRTRLGEATAELRDRLTRLQAGVTAGRGTVGRGVSDRELQDQLVRLRATLDSARAELKADPLRWLRLRLF